MPLDTRSSDTLWEAERCYRQKFQTGIGDQERILIGAVPRAAVLDDTEPPRRQLILDALLQRDDAVRHVLFDGCSSSWSPPRSSNDTSTPGSPSWSAPCTRNDVASRVLPQPGPPHTSVARPVGSGRPLISGSGTSLSSAVLPTAFAKVIMAKAPSYIRILTPLP